MNNTFLKAFEKLLIKREIDFHHKNNRIMCFPHVINICTTHVIEGFTDPLLVDDTDEFTPRHRPEDPGFQTLEDAITRDPIALCRGTIRAIRASGQRRDRFDETIQDGNARNWFKDPDDETKDYKVPQKQLLRDVKTRWDSVYLMIKRFRQCRPVCNL